MLSKFLSADTDPRLADLFEQVLSLLAANDTAAVTELFQAHPEYADRLNVLLPTLQVLADLSPPSSQSPAVEVRAANEVQPGGILGDFRVGTEIGRGGMGVVYEAEQISLRRRVALKMLPLAAMLDERALLRFRNEAQAAAGLHHPHIVPIYAVGQERGVHYFAMQYIDGVSLDRWLAARRKAENDNDDPGINFARSRDTEPVALLTTQPSLLIANHWQIAVWGIQAAEALHYAHELGIIHRDIKPGNLLIDGRGSLWIADFGLAQMEGDANLTLTGDVLGTLRYMSPEQASGMRLGIDQRTDVYSLGATLYELLTLRPAVEGQDRREVLRHLLQVESRSLRKHDPTIPNDLDTIVLKCLAKDPKDRYSTAADLAADLQRFCDGQNIHARRPTVAQFCAKWSRRHSSLLLAASAGLAVAVLVATIATGLLWQERSRTLAALKQSNENAAKAEVQRQQAEANFRRALDGVGYLFAPLQAPELADNPVVRDIRRMQTDQAIEFCRAFLREHDDDPNVRLQIAITQVHIGGMLKSQGELTRTEESYRAAITQFERLVQEFPEHPRYRVELAQAYNILGLELFDNGRTEHAREAFAKALPEYQAAVRLAPDNAGAIHLASWFLINCPDEQFRDANLALKYSLSAVEKNPRGGSLWNTLGIAYYRSGQFVEALAALEKSIAIQQGGDSQDWFFLAMTHWRLGHHDEARQWYAKAMQWRMEKNRTSDVEMRRFRAEADRVMSLPGSPGS